MRKKVPIKDNCGNRLTLSVGSKIESNIYSRIIFFKLHFFYSLFS